MSLPIPTSIGQQITVDGKTYQAISIDPPVWDGVTTGTHETRIEALEGVSSFKEISLALPMVTEGGVIRVRSFYADKGYGGGNAIYVTEPASSHMTKRGNRFYIAVGAIEAWDGSQANLTQLLNWTPNTSTGCVYINLEESDITHLGGVIDDFNVDNTTCIHKLADVLGYVKLPETFSPVTMNTPVDVGGKYQVKFMSTLPVDSAFDSSQPLDEQEYLVKVYAPNGLTTNATNDRCRLNLSGLLVYGSGRGLGQVFAQGRGALYLDNAAVLEYDKLTENDFAFISYITRCKFDRLNWFAHIATANGFYIRDCFFGSQIQKIIDMEGLTLGPDAISTGYPICIERCNINCGTNTDFIARTRGGFIFNENYVECFSDTAGDSLFLHRAGRFDNGFYEIGHGNEINAQSHTANLVKFYGDNAAGTQNFKGRIGRQQRIIGFTSATPVVIGEPSTSFPSASTEIARVDVEYPIGVDRRGNFYNYEGDFTCADGTVVDCSGTSWVTLPLTQTYPTESTDAISAGNTWTKRSAGTYDIRAEVSISSTTVIRNMELAIYVNGSLITRVRASIETNASTSGTYYETVTFGLDAYTLARGDDVQVRARQGGSAYVAKLSARRLD